MKCADGVVNEVTRYNFGLMYLATLSPFLVGECGTHWPDVASNQNLANGRVVAGYVDVEC